MVANDIDNKKVTSNMRRENEFINVPQSDTRKGTTRTTTICTIEKN